MLRAMFLSPVLAASMFAQQSAAEPSEPRAERSNAQLIADLLEADLGRGAQLELLRRGESAAAELGRALHDGFGSAANASAARGGIARVLMELGAAGAPAFAELVACVRDFNLDPETVHLAALALERIGPFAGPAREKFLAALVGDQPRRQGAWVFHRAFFTDWGRVASSVVVDGLHATVDQVIASLKSPNPYERVTAARVLAARAAEFTAHQRRVVAALEALIDADFDPSVDWSWEVERVPQYCRTSADTVRWIRTEASLALVAYRPTDELTMLGHSQRLFALDPLVRIDAARALGKLRRADAATWLVAAIRQGDPELTRTALVAIERTGPELAYLAPELAEIRAGADPGVRDAIVRTLRVIAPDADETTPIRPVVEILGVEPTAAIPLHVETQRLNAWLDADGGRNRHRLQDDVRHIERFHELAADAGGPFDRRTRWVPVRIGPDEFRPGSWATLEQGPKTPGVLATPRDSVGPRRERLRPLPWIVELHVVDRSQARFAGTEIQWSPLRSAGSYAFRIEAESAAAFLGLENELFQRHGSLALVVDGLVVWFRSIDAQTALDHAGGGFGILPAAADRARALQIAVDRR